MALVTMVKGVVINGRAYKRGEICDLRTRDLDFAIAHGYGELYRPDTSRTPQQKLPASRRRKKT